MLVRNYTIIKFRSLSLLALALAMPITSFAVDGVTISGGGFDADRDRVGGRISARWEWDDNIYEWSNIELGGYWEPSIGYWHAQNTTVGENDKLWVFAVSPVFQLRPLHARTKRFAPFLEFGIGVSWMTQDDIGGRELGSTYHFEDRLGVGLRINCRYTYEFSYRYFHYSNASIEHPNSGLDAHTLNLSLLW